MLLRESVDTEIDASIWFHWMKKTSSLIEDKTQKAHPTGEFAIVA